MQKNNYYLPSSDVVNITMDEGWLTPSSFTVNSLRAYFLNGSKPVNSCEVVQAPTLIFRPLADQEESSATVML